MAGVIDFFAILSLLCNLCTRVFLVVSGLTVWGMVSAEKFFFFVPPLCCREIRGCYEKFFGLIFFFLVLFSSVVYSCVRLLFWDYNCIRIEFVKSGNFFGKCVCVLVIIVAVACVRARSCDNGCSSNNWMCFLYLLKLIDVYVHILEASAKGVF